jgi:hypothetical protein
MIASTIILKSGLSDLTAEYSFLYTTFNVLGLTFVIILECFLFQLWKICLKFGHFLMASSKISSVF